MKHRLHKRIILYASAALIIILLLLVVGACDPYAPLRFENQTGQTLSIFILKCGAVQMNIHAGDLAPGEESFYRELMRCGIFKFEAKTVQGRVVFSKEFTADELIDMDWKVVIK